MYVVPAVERTEYCTWLHLLHTFTFRNQVLCPRPILLILLDKVRMQNDAYVNHEGVWGNGISTAQLMLKLNPIWR